LKVSLISVPYDQVELGRGVGLAPSIVFQAGLLARLQAVGIETVLQTALQGEIPPGDPASRFGVLAGRVAQQVAQACREGALPVILGGDCMAGVGAAAGLQRAFGAKPFGIAWMDAHGDFNTPEISLSGFIPGMPLACICGHGLDALRTAAALTPVDPAAVIMLGVRDLDPAEKDLLDSTPISYLDPAEVQAGRTQTAAGYHFQNVERVYLHLDIDALDPAFAPGVDFPSQDGITPEDAVTAGRAVQQAAPLAALSVTAFNPEKDVDGKMAALVVELIAEILA